MPNDIPKSRRGSRHADPQRGGPLAHLTNRQILIAIWKGLQYMGQNLTQLTASVTRNTDVTASAVVMIHGLAEQIRNATDPAELAALATQLDSSADALAAAITANTPVEPEPADPA